MISIPQRLTASRIALLSGVTSGDPVLDEVSSFIGGRDPDAAIIRLGPQEVRRIDLWLGPDATCIVPFGPDEQGDARCLFDPHPVSLAIVAGIVTDSERTTSAGPGEPVTFDSLEALAAGVAEGRFPGARATVIQRARSNCVDTLVRLVDDGVRWGRAESDEPLELRPGRQAQFWAALLDLLSVP